MEPLYSDGDIVCVKKTIELQSGNVGIFFYDGNTYIKRLEQISNGRYMLVSENPKYDPIVINPMLPFNILGIVLT